MYCNLSDDSLVPRPIPSFSVLHALGMGWAWGRGRGYSCDAMQWLVFGIFFFSQVIDKDGVFSVQANLSRLRAELTIQANKRYRSFGRWHYSRKLLISMYTRTRSLNIPAIRRQLLTQHRSLHPISTGYERGCARLPPLPQWRPRKKTPPKPPTSLEKLKLVSMKAQTMTIILLS